MIDLDYRPTFWSTEDEAAPRDRRGGRPRHGRGRQPARVRDRGRHERPRCRRGRAARSRRGARDREARRRRRARRDRRGADARRAGAGRGRVRPRRRRRASAGRSATACSRARRPSRRSGSRTPPARSSPRGCSAPMRCRPPTRCDALLEAAGAPRVSDLLVPAGTAADGDDALVITPERAGWTYCGLRVARLAAGRVAHARRRAARSSLSLPLAGSAIGRGGRSPVRARGPDERLRPRHRLGVRARSTPRCGCRATGASSWRWPRRARERRFEPAYVRAADVPVEIRGAGQATRQVTNFLAPGAFDAVDRLICVEVLTPDGNWSSYPPHKHDDTPGLAREQRGDLLLPRRARRLDRDERRGLRAPPHVHCRRLDRRDRRRPRRRRLPRPAWLPRAVRRRARLPALLPQRDGRTEPASARWRSSTTRRTAGSAPPGTA